jgi:GNAT superfamily N-acetyltransferase
MLRIRRLRKSDIPLLQNFPPEDWNLNLPHLLSFHFDYSYFYTAVAEIDKKVVGCGIAMMHKPISWLGTIIVLPEYRGQGIGTGITSSLVEYCESKGCKNQILVASEMGEPVYRKLGFITSATYVFFKRESAVPIQPVSNVREIRKDDIKKIKELDKNISGEKRFAFIKRFLTTGLVYESENSNKITGIYLPDYGTGLIIAEDSTAGLMLVKLRFNQGQKKIVVPSSNTITQEYLLSKGFEEYRRAPRMVLGEDVNWIPSMVYNRGTGYCG